MKRSIWQIRSDVDAYDTLDDNKKKEVLGEVIELQEVSSWHYHWIVDKLCGHLYLQKNISTIYDLIKSAIDKDLGLSDSYFESYLVRALKTGELKKKVLDLLLTTSNNKVKKFLLGIPGISEKDEELGIRDMSRTKYVPDFILGRKYKPSKAVLDKLPPVMRLKVLESLTENFHIGYNVLENIPSLEDCRQMLFGSVLRHRERAEAVVKRYLELTNLGQPKTFNVDIECKICGPINIKVTTGKIKDENRLEQTSLRQVANKHRCPICGNTNIKTQITWED